MSLVHEYLETIPSGIEIKPTSKNSFEGWSEYFLCQEAHEIGLMTKRIEDIIINNRFRGVNVYFKKI